jgi:MYXO-CTERM domain-containing protein
MIRWVTAVLMGLATTAVASPRVDCAADELIGANYAMVSIEDMVFELGTFDDLPEHILSPEAFCAMMPEDFEAFILPVPRLPDEMPAGAPMQTISGDMIEPVGAPGLPGLQTGSTQAAPDLDDDIEMNVVIEQASGLEIVPAGFDEPAPSPSREGEDIQFTGGCSAAPNGQSPAWFGVLALLALARRRAVR